MSMKTERQRLFYLDLIRVAAAVLIVIYHFPFSIGGAVDPLHGTVNGSWGMTPVYCFFMVSGAALFHRYGREEKLPVKTFYKKRFFSIYPLFWIAYILGFFATYWQLGHFYHIPTWSFIWSILGLDGWIVNWIPTFYMVGEWFLGSIIILYLAFPLVRWCWRKSRSITMLVSLAAALALFWYHPFPMDIKQNPVVDLFYFLLGAWFEEMRSYLSAGRMEKKGQKAGAKGEKGRISRVSLLLWLASAAVMAVWFFVPVTEGLPSMEATFSAQAVGSGIFLRQSFILLTTCAFYIFCMGIAPYLERWKHGKKIILEISGKTYGIFLTHHMISQILCGHFDGASLSTREVLAVLFLVFAVTWAVTVGIYRIEAYIKERF
ncbi:MAG TPA: acyltransferase [Candidatus Caccovicinus merdipullorum]|uniref:Acyltransferase n=1 Tax=Candidatus Caccovicinus merdipullorum TaxID=2840724 RepID=A0A9D1GJY7_9FIRM|nr:acyltransferase [Candidatus Caccovicinus merdipullorum]